LSKQYNQEETNLSFQDGVYREGANEWVDMKEKEHTELTRKQTWNIVRKRVARCHTSG
jgi:hypothetical protein